MMKLGLCVAAFFIGCLLTAFMRADASIGTPADQVTKIDASLLIPATTQVPSQCPAPQLP